MVSYLSILLSVVRLENLAILPRGQIVPNFVMTESKVFNDAAPKKDIQHYSPRNNKFTGI